MDQWIGFHSEPVALFLLSETDALQGNDFGCVCLSMRSTPNGQTSLIDLIGKMMISQ